APGTTPRPAGRRAVPIRHPESRRSPSLEKHASDRLALHEEWVEVVGLGQATGLPPEQVIPAARGVLVRRGAEHAANPGGECGADRGLIGTAQLVRLGERRIVLE